MVSLAKNLSLVAFIAFGERGVDCQGRPKNLSMKLATNAKRQEPEQSGTLHTVIQFWDATFNYFFDETCNVSTTQEKCEAVQYYQTSTCEWDVYCKNKYNCQTNVTGIANSPDPTSSGSYVYAAPNQKPTFTYVVGDASECQDYAIQNLQPAGLVTYGPQSDSSSIGVATMDWYSHNVDNKENPFNRVELQAGFGPHCEGADNDCLLNLRASASIFPLYEEQALWMCSVSRVNGIIPTEFTIDFHGDSCRHIHSTAKPIGPTENQLAPPKTSGKWLFFKDQQAYDSYPNNGYAKVSTDGVTVIDIVLVKSAAPDILKSNNKSLRGRN